jgi:hypothetical protein
MSPSGLVMPAWKRGFCLRIAESSVLPERGSPEMKCSFSGGLPAAGLVAAGFPAAGWSEAGLSGAGLAGMRVFPKA